MHFNHPERRTPSPTGRRRAPSARGRRRLELSWEACESRTLLAGSVFQVSITPTAVSVPRPDTGVAFATFQVTLSPPDIETPITVDYTTTDGTAVGSTNPATGDYVRQSGTLTFPIASTAPQTIQVAIPARTADEITDKTFFVDLSNAATAPPTPNEPVGIINSRGTVTIVNTHQAGRVQFAASTFQVDASAGTAQITVTRTGGNASDAGAVFSTTTTGTAVPGVDFTPVTVPVTFGFGQSVATVTVPVNPQALSTQDVTVGLQLQQPFGNATLGTLTTATLVIHRVNPLIVTTQADTGIGSLRTAIAFADSPQAPANPVIRFAITKEGFGPFTIAPLTPLPAVTRPLTVDATTQPGYVNLPTVTLSGARLPGGSNGTQHHDGLTVTAGHSAIVGLAINGFSGSAIVLDGAGSNVVARDVLGTDRTGSRAVPNLFDGVFINASAGNTVAGNVISGNGNVGVQIETAAASGNTISRNTIGTDPTGNVPLPNALDGVFIDGAPGNTIVSNLISGNGSVGVQLYNPTATRNMILNNTIGTNRAGRAATPNATDGVFLNGAPGNTVTGNLISGNRSVGVQALGANATRNVIQNNTIGTDVTRLFAIPNAFDGVFLNNAPGNLVASNLISGNGSVGVQVFGPGSSGDSLQGNTIGLDARNQPLGNNYGVFLNGIPANAPGSVPPESQNLIRGNRVAQVFRAVPAQTAQGTALKAASLKRPAAH